MNSASALQTLIELQSGMTLFRVALIDSLWSDSTSSVHSSQVTPADSGTCFNYNLPSHLSGYCRLYRRPLWSARLHLHKLMHLTVNSLVKIVSNTGGSWRYLNLKPWLKRNSRGPLLSYVFFSPPVWVAPCCYFRPANVEKIRDRNREIR